jgi:hypothetical protein
LKLALDEAKEEKWGNVGIYLGQMTRDVLAGQ